MLKPILLITLILFTAADTSAQTLNAEQLVREWFQRLNALDDWFISMEGKEEHEPVVNRFIELYDPEALQLVGPNENQLGTAPYHRHQGIRKWTDDFARTFVQLAYRLEVQTVKEKTASLIYATPMPWGGAAVSVEFVAVYSLRQNRKKYAAPGAAFFQFSEDGKIQRLRLFIPKDEAYEVIR